MQLLCENYRRCPAYIELTGKIEKEVGRTDDLKKDFEDFRKTDFLNMSKKLDKLYWVTLTACVGLSVSSLLLLVNVLVMSQFTGNSEKVVSLFCL